MPDDLWQIRKRKGLSVAQLAAKTGLSSQLITDYETGQPIPASDRFKLAKALYVFDKDIKPISAPPPVAAPPPAPIKPPVEKKPEPAQPAPPPPPPVEVAPAKPIEPPPPPAPKIPTKRAALPEGIDQFEFDYLTAAQQTQATLTVKLFNGDVIDGTLKTVKRYPGTSLTIAALIGFYLGRLFRR